MPSHGVPSVYHLWRGEHTKIEIPDAFSCLINDFFLLPATRSACRSIPPWRPLVWQSFLQFATVPRYLVHGVAHPVSSAFISSSSTNDNTPNTPDVPAVLVEIFLFLEETVANAAVEGDDLAIVGVVCCYCHASFNFGRSLASSPSHPALPSTITTIFVPTCPLLELFSLARSEYIYQIISRSKYKMGVGIEPRSRPYSPPIIHCHRISLNHRRCHCCFVRITIFCSRRR